MKTEKASYQQIEDAIIELYLRIKIRKETDVRNNNKAHSFLNR